MPKHHSPRHFITTLPSMWMDLHPPHAHPSPPPHPRPPRTGPILTDHPLPPLHAATIVCEQRDWQINNFQLQNILYAAHAIYMHKRSVEHPLIAGDFYAWDCGPVHPEVFQAAINWGTQPITENVILNTDILPENWQARPPYTFLHSSSEVLAPLPPDRLQRYARQKGGAWAAVYDARGWPKRVNPIPNTLIRAQYRLSAKRQEKR